MSANLVLAVLASVTFAQSAQIPAVPQARPIVVTHAVVHTVAANGPQTILDGYVLFDRGVITAIGSGEPKDLPANVKTYDAKGLHVAPGFMGTMTQLGLIEVIQVQATDDRAEFGEIHPEVVAATAINPDSDLFPVTRASGVLLAMTAPTGGLISGRASALRLDGWTIEEMAIDRDIGVVINWPLVEPVFAWWTKKPAEEQAKKIKQDLEAIDRFFADAAASLDRVDAFPETRKDQRFEAMRGVLKNKDPIFITAGSQGQIESAVAWALRRGLQPSQLVVVGGRGLQECIPLFKQHDIAVIVDGIHRLPGRADLRYDEPFSLPKKLKDAGVRFAIASGAEPAHERNLPHNAGTAAAYGLSPDEALTAITRSPAELCGIGDRYGSLAPGKSATLFLSTGDPLEITSDVVLAFIDGRTIDLGSRQKRLLEKYSEKYRQLGIPIDMGTK